MPYFPPNPAPFALYEPDLLAGGFGALTAGAAYIHSYVLRAPVVVTAFQCAFSGSPTGNVDMGILDASFNLLVHTGATAATTGVQKITLGTPFALSPGRYWLAWMDTVADSVQKIASLSGLNNCQRSTVTNLTVLTSSLSFQATTTRVMLMALLSGGSP